MVLSFTLSRRMPVAHFSVCFCGVRKSHMILINRSGIHNIISPSAHDYRVAMIQLEVHRVRTPDDEATVVIHEFGRYVLPLLPIRPTRVVNQLSGTGALRVCHNKMIILLFHRH